MRKDRSTAGLPFVLSLMMCAFSLLMAGCDGMAYATLVGTEDLWGGALDLTYSVTSTPASLDNQTCAKVTVKNAIRVLGSDVKGVAIYGGSLDWKLLNSSATQIGHGSEILEDDSLDSTLMDSVEITIPGVGGAQAAVNLSDLQPVAYSCVGICELHTKHYPLVDLGPIALECGKAHTITLENSAY